MPTLSDNEFVADLGDGRFEAVLDVCWDGYDSIDECLADYPHQRGRTSIVTEIVNPHGPGGGWPVVRFTGSQPDMESLISQYFSTND